MTSPREPGSLRAEAQRLAELAWPVVLGQLGIVMLGVVDVLMLGRLGQDAIGAVGIGNTWSFGVLIVGLGTAMGLDPLVAQAYGAGRVEDAGVALVRGCVVLAALAVPIVALHLLAGPLLLALDQPPHLVQDAAAYCAIIAISVPSFLGFAVVRQFLQGSGTMRPAMWVLLVGNVVNVVLDDALIFGRLGLPAMGVTGAAWATVVVRWGMFGMLVAVGWPLLRQAWPSVPSAALTRGALVAVAAIAIPTGFQVALEVWAFTAASLFAGSLGDTAVAAHTVALSISSVLFMVPLGLGAASATRIGNLVGAGATWTGASRAALVVTLAVMVASAFLLLALPGPLVRLYTDDPPVVALAVTLLPIAAAFQVFDGLQAVAFGLLRGLGDTRLPALFNVVGHWMLGLPVGAWLAFVGGFGLTGLWIGLSVGLGAVSAMLLTRLWQHARAITPL